MRPVLVYYYRTFRTSITYVYIVYISLAFLYCVSCVHKQRNTHTRTRKQHERARDPKVLYHRLLKLLNSTVCIPTIICYSVLYACVYARLSFLSLPALSSACRGPRLLYTHNRLYSVRFSTPSSSHKTTTTTTTMCTHCVQRTASTALMRQHAIVHIAHPSPLPIQRQPSTDGDHPGAQRHNQCRVMYGMHNARGGGVTKRGHVNRAARKNIKTHCTLRHICASSTKAARVSLVLP